MSESEKEPERLEPKSAGFFVRIAFSVLALGMLSGFFIQRLETQHRIDEICQARKDARTDENRVLLSLIDLFPSTPETDQARSLVTDRDPVKC